LAVWKECGEAAARTDFSSRRRVRRRESQNSFELYSEYTASWKIGKYREEFSVFFLAKYRKI